MWWKILLGIVVLGLAAVLVSLGLGWQKERQFQRFVASATPVTFGAPISRKGPVDAVLPEPVGNYLAQAIDPGSRAVHLALLTQTGGMRLDPSDDRWLPFSARQAYRTDPPGFVWNAKITMAPFVTVRVMDQYDKGHGAMRGWLADIVPMVDAAGKPEIDNGALMRYLAEMVWFPTAFLSTAGLTWEAVDASSAKATLKEGNISVSLVFHFNDEGLISGCEGMRYKDEGAGGRFRPLRWVGRFWEYQPVGGFMIPRHGEVSWVLEDGRVWKYWKGEITGAVYR